MSKALAALVLAAGALSAPALPLPGKPRPLFPLAFEAPPVPTEFHVADPQAPVFVGCQDPIMPEIWPEPIYAVALPAVEEKPTQPADWNIHIQFVAVVLPEATAQALVEEFDDDSKSAAAAAKAMAAVQRGEGEIAGTLLAHLHSGDEAKAEDIKEVRYALSFNDPVFPNLDSKEELARVPKDQPEIAFVPDGFESRHTGLSISAKAEVSASGQGITLQAEVTHTRFLGWDQFLAGIAPGGAKLFIPQPRFTTARDSQTIALRSGESVLAGVHTVPEQPHKTELFILKAWTTRIPAPDAEKK